MRLLFRLRGIGRQRAEQLSLQTVRRIKKNDWGIGGRIEYGMGAIGVDNGASECACRQAQCGQTTDEF